jgi:hypothetical protein
MEDIMKAFISCDYCGHPFAVLVAEGAEKKETGACTECSKENRIDKADSIMVNQCSPAMVRYILYRMESQQLANIRFDLAQIRIFEQWIKGRHYELTNICSVQINTFFADLGSHLPANKAEGLRATISHFFDVLCQEALISKNPIPLTELSDLALDQRATWVENAAAKQRHSGNNLHTVLH